MQETNKTWRVSVAGLASIAMIATMGVASATANAAESPTVTFDPNGMPGTSSFEYQTTGDLQDKQISDATTNLKTAAGSYANYFTGWYTEPEIGEGVAVQPSEISEDEVVYAHWSAPDDQYTITFDPSSVVTGGVAKNSMDPVSVTLASTDNAMDLVSAWQVPSEDVQGDETVVTGWKTSGANPVAVDPTADWTGIALAGGSNHKIEVVPETADAFEVTFGYVDFSGKEWDLNNQKQNTVKYDVKQNTSLADAGISFPTATLAGRKVTKWLIDASDNKDASKKGDEFTTATVVTENTTVRPGAAENYYEVTFNANNGTASSTVEVAEGDTVAKPADPTKEDADVKYVFDGWYVDGDAYDFSSPVKGPLTLDAKYKATAIKVSFNPAYGQEKIVDQWYSDGDTFSAPEFTRDGYTMTWSVSLPENAVLSIDQETSQLTYRKADGATGHITAGTVYEASWTSNDKITLPVVEGYVVVSDGEGGYLSGKEQSTFTADSYDQYIKDYQKYLNDKVAAANNGGGISVDERTQLFKELREAQAKLIFNRTLGVTRLYNDATRRHNLTKDSYEVKVNTANGFHVENVAFKVVDTTKAAAQAVYKGNSVDHYAVSEDGGVLTPNGADVLLKTVYRYYNAGIDRQLYTADDNEVKTLEQTGWRHEADNDLYIPANGDITVYRYYITATMEHVMTTDQNEYDTLTALDPGMYHGDAMTFKL